MGGTPGHGDGTIDPVAEADAYVEMLLGLLGDRDPVQVQEELPGLLEDLVERAGANLRARPGPGEWSVLELIGHLVDSELVSAGRYRWTVAHDEPPLVGYDQDLWVERLRHNDDDPAELLGLLRALRRANLWLWQGSSAEERARVGMHAERGPESFDLTFRLSAAHGLFHLDQAERTLAGLPEAPAG